MLARRAGVGLGWGRRNRRRQTETSGDRALTAAPPSSSSLLPSARFVIVPVIGCAFWLVFPSIGTVSKYLGAYGLGLYVVAVPLVLAGIGALVYPRLDSLLTEKQARLLALATLLVLVAAFAALRPITGVARAGHGSDRNEAMNLATAELLHGHYPYHPMTHLGNPISPLPGSLLLAAPFVWLGDSAYQNFAWLAVFFVAARRQLRDSRKALLLIWAALALSPVVAQEIVTGGDLLANSIYVLIFILALLRHPEQGVGWFYAALLGVGLSSRANFLLLLPLVLAALARRAGWGRALKLMAVSCATFAAVTVPFYLADPQGFSPLHTVHKFDAASSGLPLGGGIVLLLDAGLAVALLLRHRGGGYGTLLRDCAIVLALPVVGMVVLLSVRAGRADLASAGYGLWSIFFGLLGCAIVRADPGARGGSPEPLMGARAGKQERGA